NEPEAAIPNAVTTRATTIAFKMRDIFMNLPLFVFAVDLETRSESQPIRGCFFLHPVLSLSSSPCSGGIRRFAECFTFCRRNNRTEIRYFFESGESDEDSLRRSARSRRGRKRF